MQMEKGRWSGERHNWVPTGNGTGQAKVLTEGGDLRKSKSVC